MKVQVYPETHSVYLELRPEPAVDSFEWVPGIVVDVNAEGLVVGLDVDTEAVAPAIAIDQADHALRLKAVATS
jgi:uncharacterized protein YuzE